MESTTQAELASSNSVLFSALVGGGIALAGVCFFLFALGYLSELRGRERAARYLRFALWGVPLGLILAVAGLIVAALGSQSP